MENDKQKPQAQLRGQRTLTVSSLLRQWGVGHRKNECSVPSIRLNGKWLAALGYQPGPYSQETEVGVIKFVEWYCATMAGALEGTPKRTPTLVA